jgi:hypothetical protein
VSIFAKSLPIAGALLLATGAIQAHAQIAPPFFSYAAKFVCGTSKVDADVVIGVYETDINIHNPAGKATVKFLKKAVITTSGIDGTTIPLTGDFLAPDHVEEITCADISVLLAKTQGGTAAHIEGFVVLEVPPIGISSTGPVFLPLDVVGKYTARTLNPNLDGISLSIVPVVGKEITE